MEKCTSNKKKKGTKQPPKSNTQVPLGTTCLKSDGGKTVLSERDSSKVKVNEPNTPFKKEIQDKNINLHENIEQCSADISANLMYLSNNPEISITVTNEHLPQKNNHVSLPNESEVVSNTSKKKKKKKKKKAAASNLETKSENVTETVSNSPTYVKLPANDGTCVLVVSHEKVSETIRNKNAAENVFPTAGNIINYSEIKQNNGEPPNSKQLKHVESACLNAPSTVSVGLTQSSANSLVLKSNSSTVNETTVCPSTVDVNKKSNEASDQAEGNNEDNVEANKISKAKLKAERRALQEAQRAAKAEKHTATSSVNKKQSAQEKCIAEVKDEKKQCLKNDIKAKLKTERNSPEMHNKGKHSKMSLFSHLPQFHSYNFLSKFLKTHENIHPAIVAVGSKYAKGIICGSNARCIAMLAAFTEVIKDYETPPKKELCRDLEESLQACMSFLSKCRPLSVSMINAMKFLKYHVTHMSINVNDQEAKETLHTCIEKFVKEEILLAKDAICSYAAEKIVDGDVILTYSYSSVVKEVLYRAVRDKKQFQVIIIDSRPKMEGQEMLRYLLKEGVTCAYTLINAVSYAMKNVSKVIIGAHALQANGYVMSRIGCSQIARVACWYNVPVLVCCETYKFCERVHTDSFVYNELGDPQSLAKINLPSYCDVTESQKDLPSLQLLNLMYDITPPDFVSVVVTEKGMLPCTSVPVVLRVRYAGSQDV